MVDYAKINKRWWDQVTPIHARSKFYDLNGFKNGKSSLNSVELRELRNVRDKYLLHLMCHFGLDTLSWAREGAIVTGVDFSDDATKLAKKISKSTRIPSTFICSDIFELPNVLDQKFDILYASYGVLCWVEDIKKFTKLINHFLKTGGVFYMAELHPFTNILAYDFTIDYKYFTKGPLIDDSSGTYTDWDADIHSETYLWNHTLSEIINALLLAGLKIEFVHEFPYSMYNQFPGLMEIDKKGHYVLKNKKIQIPLLFSIKARK